ncbi:MAG: methylated-DNA--[protein]-cysteine S-methyltransferase [Gemmatimonadaceae bacterium]|nr:methylated-DNA--[protein]-cysteine S-methyltransferase [Gemmatimonadaceae bacterium]
MTTAPSSDYLRMVKAIAFLDRPRDAAASLADLAAHLGLSEYHLQRTFTRWVGISPKRFVQHRTAELARTLLKERRSVLDVTYEIGLSGPARLHDLVLNAEAVSPGELQSGGEGVDIRWGIQETPLGDTFIAVTPRGICSLLFVNNATDRQIALERLAAEWPRASISAGRRETAEVAAAALGGVRRDEPLGLHVRGTNFQLKVWRALLAIPDGQVTTYADVARAIGHPKAVRAVGSAVGANPISVLIPCHRVLRGTGELGGYAWGIERKGLLLRAEFARTA